MTDHERIADVRQKYEIPLWMNGCGAGGLPLKPRVLDGVESRL
jgi:hypothetical protein